MPIRALTAARRWRIPLAALAMAVLWLGLGSDRASAKGGSAEHPAVVLSLSRATGTPVLIWSPGIVTPSIVTVAVDGGSQELNALGTGGSLPVPWVTAGSTFVFRLFSLHPRQRVLAILTAGRRTSTRIVARPPNPDVSVTPGFINRFLQLAGLASLLLVATLLIKFVRAARRAT